MSLMKPLANRLGGQTTPAKSLVMPRYSEYKDSGVEWLGEVPGHWEVVPLKHLAEFINGDAFKPTEWAVSGFPIIRIQNLNGSEDFNYYDGEVEQRYLVHDGDLLFGWSGNRGTSFGPFLWRRNEVCALNQHIFRVVPISAEKRSLYWTLKAVTAHVEDQAHGIIGMVHVTKGDLGAINVPVAPIAEQTLIAAFLDRETGKIDALIAEQRRLVELLAEKRQAVISHAVTKGLNPNIPMKDSGIEWLGEVPEHWDVKRLKYVGKAFGGLIYDPSEIVEEGNGTLVLRSSNVQNGRIVFDDNVYVTTTIPEKIVTQSGDILVCSRNGSRALIGKNAMIDDDSSGVTFGAFMMVFRSRNNGYIFHVFNSQLFKFQSGAFLTATINQLTVGNLYSMEVPLPPVDEQQTIATFLNRENAQFDTLTVEANRAIALLQERRSALISAAVTGKIDVREQQV